MRLELVRELRPARRPRRARRRARRPSPPRARASPHRPPAPRARSPSMVTMRCTCVVRAMPRHADRVARPDHARGDRAGIAAEIEIRAVDPLHRHAERALCASRPPPRPFRDARAGSGRNTTGVRALLVMTLSPKRAEIGIATIDLKPNCATACWYSARIASKHVLAEIDEVDLVDREHDMADAEQARDEGMPPRLRQHAVAGVDQHDGEVGVRGAGRHVARVLLVARACRRR